MKMQAIVPLPLGEFDIISRDVALKMIGKRFPATNENHEKVGNAVIIDVDYRSSNDVLLTIEMEVNGNA